MIGYHAVSVLADMIVKGVKALIMNVLMRQ